MDDLIDASSIENYDESDYEINTDQEDYNSDDIIDDEDDENCYEAADSHTIDMKVKNYTVLEKQDIKQRVENDITEISNLLQVSTEEACLLLRAYNWSVGNVHEEWFANEKKVRKSVGIMVVMPKFYSPGNTRYYECGICFDYFRSDRLESAGCGHLYCRTCWGMYIMTSVNDGPGCLLLRCPEPKCRMAVGQNMVDRLVGDEFKERYHGFLHRSYVESNRKIKWCPAPGCEFAVEFVIGSENRDVICGCKYGFCWGCVEETHRPVDCETVGKWILKNSSEAENTSWIIANCKPCPKCKRSIEKNQGCMHMTCGDSCRYEFCWLCLGDWKEHGSKTGGYYACNRYTEAKNTGAYDESQRKREMAKQALERYTHYYERWASNNVSRQKALEALNEMETVHLENLSKAQDIPVTQLEFVLEAWKQIVECRRVLKWTYAYGYYLPDKGTTEQVNLFEFLQGQAETGLERLHSNAEQELMKFIKPDEYGEKISLPSEFPDFRQKLAHLTMVSRMNFDNLVRSLENGLNDLCDSPLRVVQ